VKDFQGKNSFRIEGDVILKLWYVKCKKLKERSGFRMNHFRGN
jgi:hypothetical protein